ncbi:hypothetical protein MMC13_000039 [Lambiella insularis]|nr:hypothetical protein [Lambiella insularis]
MVVFVDLSEDDQLDPYRVQRLDNVSALQLHQSHSSGYNDEWASPNTGGFSAALACYPIVTQLARSLDLNSLHALSRTCRQFRASLLQFRRQLVQSTLRCVNESGSARDICEFQNPNRLRTAPVHMFGMGLLTNGKVGACARDMVSECRHCGKVVCRNCTMKSPSKTAFTQRHRRLCSTCLAAPQAMLTGSSTTASSAPTFTTPALTRGRCTCPDMFYMCQPCGHAINNADTTYKRIWTWRTRYSCYLGGLGTGIGEGNEGVKCGRGDHCLAAKDIEVEIDSAADGLSSIVWVDAMDETALDSWTDTGEKAGYLTQEMEGIGGVVKKKVKKRVKVGKTVFEYEDERTAVAYLLREIRGQNRSWCGWCDRVIPGLRDL